MSQEQRSASISADPDVQGGTPVFRGTRVPVQSLFDHLEAGESIDDFLAGFTTVKREQVIALLQFHRLGRSLDYVRAGRRFGRDEANER